MSIKEPVRLTVTIFPDDDPALVAWAAGLPTSRPRRRSAFLRAILAGLNGRVTTPAEHRQIESSPPEQVAAVAAPKASRKKQTASQPAMDSVLAAGISPAANRVELHPGDLAEIFG